MIDLAQATLEHVYPQNPPSTAQVDSTLERHKHSLANLSFWPPQENSQAGNRPFAQKRSAYANSRVSLNRDLSALASWDATELSKRRSQLKSWAERSLCYEPLSVGGWVGE
ncbi:HNH endonuclease family protein [Geodermatophilus dictyosporus]|uniref:HNH endonuclease family protein n=1 Tax=Geodermatophilus dictyosporus TaxID=1523247 RepID=UPI00145C1C28